MSQIGVDVGSYAFDAKAGTVTFSGVTLSSIEQIKLIANESTGEVLFSPVNKTVGRKNPTFGTLLGNVLTLNYDTSKLGIDSNKLYICINNPASDSIVKGELNSLPENIKATPLSELKVAIGSTNLDGFARVRVSQITTQFDAKQLYDKLPLFIDEELIGTATATHSTSLARTQLSTAATSDAAIMQTKQRFNYQSGKSQQLFWTFHSLGDGSNIYLKVNRSGTSVDSVIRASWDDPLDGTGRSGVTHDFDNNTIMMVDFEWLGVGNIRWFVIKNGMPILFHELDHTDTTEVYMSSPNKPMRWELRQTGAGAYTSRVGYFSSNTTTPFNSTLDGFWLESTDAGSTFDYICSSVNTEGSINKIGKVLSDNLGTTHVNANSTGNKYAILGLRLNSSNVDALIDLIDYTILSTTSDNQLVEVWLNPTVSGTFTFNSVTNSSIQIAKGSSGGSNTITGGTLLFSGYISQQTATSVAIENAIRLGAKIDGTLDEIVITANPLSSNSDVLGSVTWRELT